MTIQFEILTAGIGIALSIFAFYVGRQTNAKSAGIRDGILDADLKYMKTAIDEIKSELKETNLSALKVMLEELKKRVDRHDDALTRLGTKIEGTNN